MTFAVAFANGVCPCGLASAVKSTVAWHRASQRLAIHQTCPACQKEDRGGKRDSREPNVEKCALMVSGDVPTAGASVPPLDAMPAPYLLPVVVGVMPVV